MSLLELLQETIESGGEAGLLFFIFAGFTAVVVWLLKDRNRILKTVLDRDKTIKCLINKYHEGQKQNINAITALHEVMVELKAMITYKDKK